MAAEPRRGCGYRKIGATYLECDARAFACGVLPFELAPCPLCDHRPPFTRGIQRITPRNILHQAKPCSAPPSHCEACPAGKAMEAETAGLMWIGDRFYTVTEFNEEANRLGISKRVPAIPQWLEIGKTWIFLAYGKVFSESCARCRGAGKMLVVQTAAESAFLEECEYCENGRVHRPGVFRAFIPQRLVRIIPDTMPEAERATLRKQGLTLVEVPHDDPDHQPTRGRKDDD
jgi:hypothetical protein